MNIVYLGLGSNLGERKQTINKALEMLNQHDCIEVTAVSKFYETEAVAKLPQPPFINGALQCETILSPTEILAATQDIETELGRDSKGNYDPRTIDLDILFYNDDIISLDNLSIPHPLLHERSFVLIPLQEIAPDLVHPVLHMTIHDLCKSLANV